MGTDLSQAKSSWLAKINRTLSVAPMMDCTDRHCRYFHRLLSKNILVYSEMIVDRAIIFGDRKRFLSFDPKEHPIAVQLGGNDPKLLAEATKIAIDFGYNEVNLNVGCPSSRVNSGNFGAALMKNVDLVSECVEAMVNVAGSTPVSVKSRIGVDNQNPDDILPNFISRVRDSGCNTFIIHARKAILKGLSPKENRKIPPLNYPIVFEMQKYFPGLEIILNGGLKSLTEAKNYMGNNVVGVMIGREIYENPSILINVDRDIFDQGSFVSNMNDVVRSMIDYCDNAMSQGFNINHILKHLKGAFKGTPTSKKFKSIVYSRELSDLEKLNAINTLLN